jgi:hypothetical protein
MKSELQKTAGTRLLTRLVEQPDLIHLVRGLDAGALGRLVNHIGLEDAGEVVALATTEQLRRLFDQDLWRADRPGEDEVFDAARFALWLEILLEAGEDFAAEKLAELDEDFVTMALHRQALVLDLDRWAVALSEGGNASEAEEAERIEKALESALSQEIDGFRLVARDPDRFEALVSVLLALDRTQHALVRRLLERCAHLGAEHIEESGGLYAVLSAAETLEDDVAGEREARREEEGYVPPSAARAFLALARTTALAELETSTAPDPIARAHFRTQKLRPLPPPAARAPGADGVPPDLERALEELEILSPRTAPRLAAAATATLEPLVTGALRGLRARAPHLQEDALRHLNFLANALIAGHDRQGRAYRPAEAGEAVLEITSEGLLHLLARAGHAAGPEEAAALVEARGVIALFKIGWHLRGRAEGAVAPPAAGPK